MLFNPLTLQQRAALGSVVVESANLEDQMNLILGHLLRLSGDEYDVLLGGQMLNRKLEVLREIGKLKIKPKKHLARLIQILDKFTNLNSDRNTVVHGRWGPPGGLWQLNWIMEGPPKGTPTVAMHKKGKKVRTFNADDLEATARAIAEANSELRQWYMKDFIKPRVKRSLRRKPPVV
jgi:hypothetical protein